MTVDSPATTAARPVPSLDLSSPEVHINPRLLQSAEMGMSASELGYTVDALVDGAYATDYFLGTDKIDLSFLLPEYLARYDGLMLMTNGNLPLTGAQKKAIVDYVRDGHGLVGVHCASLTLYDYPEFGEVLGGYYRRSIVPTTRVGQTNIGVLKVEDTIVNIIHEAAR